MKLKRKAELRRKRRTKGGDLNLSYEKRGLALGVFQRRGNNLEPRRRDAARWSGGAFLVEPGVIASEAASRMPRVT